MNKNIAITFAFIFSSAMLASYPVDLAVHQHGSVYRLMWVPKSWNINWTGVHIAYRVAGTQNWTIWNAEPIAPGIDPQRDFSKSGINPGRELSLRGKYEEFMDYNKMPAEVFRAALMAESGGLPPREVLCMVVDFQCALAMGLGAEVNTNNVVGIYEFALFPALIGGNTSSEPIAFRSMVSKSAQLTQHINASATALPNAIQLLWELPLSLYSGAGIFGFNIYRVESGKPVLLQNAAGNLPVTGNAVHYQFNYDTNRPDLPANFILAPITMFNEELAHIQVAFRPIEKTSTQPAVIHFQHRPASGSDGYPEIRINLNNLPAGTRHITIERMDPISNIYLPVARKLLPQTSSWNDTDLLEFGVSYTYRLVAELEDGSQIFSNEHTLVNLGSPKPAPVTNVSAELTRKGEQPYVRLRWQPLLHQRPPIKGYRILSDVYQQGVFTLHSDIPVITTNRYDFPLSGRFSNRTVTFQIVAITEYSQSGDEGGMVTVSVPSLRLPAPQNLRLEAIANNQIHVTWEYDSPGSFLGFRLMQNGVALADFAQIPASSRSYTLENIRPDSRGVIHLELLAVGSLAESHSAKISQKLPDHFLAPTLLKPQGISVAKVEIDGEVYAEFTWTGSPAGFGGRAFMLYADVHTQGHLSPMNSQPLMVQSPYRFKLPDPNRDIYLFEIRTLGEKRMQGPSLSLSLRLN